MWRYRVAAIAAVGFVATLGLCWAAGVGPFRKLGEPRAASSITVAGANGGAIHASDLKLQVSADAGGGCVGDERSMGRVQGSTVVESSRTIRITLRVRRGAPSEGVCAGIGVIVNTTVKLRRPVGTRRIYNPQGTVDLIHLDTAHLQYAPNDKRSVSFARAPVVALGHGRSDRAHASTLYVFGRFARSRPSLQPRVVIRVDGSRAVAAAVPTGTTGRCFRAAVDTRADTEAAPQLVNPREGQSVLVTALLTAGVTDLSHGRMRDLRGTRGSPAAIDRSLRRLAGC